MSRKNVFNKHTIEIQQKYCEILSQFQITV